MEVSVRDLKNHLSEYLRRARAGEEIVVTSHGHAVARLSGVFTHGPEQETEDAVIARLRALPSVRSASRPWQESPVQPIILEDGQTSISDLVLADRE